MIFKKRFPVYITVLIAAFLLVLFYWQMNRVVYAAKIEAGSVIKDCPPSPVIRYSSSGYRFASPLLCSDGREESKDLASLKSKIDDIIRQKKETGAVSTASVYLRLLNNSKWFSINENDVYFPASLMKVPVLMVYLHASEIIPGLLNKELYLSKQAAKQLPLQTFQIQNLEGGKSYRIGFLLSRMIVNSDNAATYLLNTNLDIPEFQKLFVDLGLPEPDVHNPKYLMTASGYSRFFRVLYNATYLSKENSELALNLLSQGEFKDGIIKGIPDGTVVAHKFGEYGEGNIKDPNNNQLHETGIFYYKGDPYLLTVMTKGSSLNSLTQTLSDISSEVYKSMN